MFCVAGFFLSGCLVLRGVRLFPEVLQGMWNIFPCGQYWYISSTGEVRNFGSSV